MNARAARLQSQYERSMQVLKAMKVLAVVSLWLAAVAYTTWMVRPVRMRPDRAIEVAANAAVLFVAYPLLAVAAGWMVGRHRQNILGVALLASTAASPVVCRVAWGLTLGGYPQAATDLRTMLEPVYASFAVSLVVLFAAVMALGRRQRRFARLAAVNPALLAFER